MKASSALFFSLLFAQILCNGFLRVAIDSFPPGSEQTILLDAVDLNTKADNKAIANCSELVGCHRDLTLATAGTPTKAAAAVSGGVLTVFVPSNTGNFFEITYDGSANTQFANFSGLNGIFLDDPTNLTRSFGIVYSSDQPFSAVFFYFDTLRGTCDLFVPAPATGGVSSVLDVPFSAFPRTCSFASWGALKIRLTFKSDPTTLRITSVFRDQNPTPSTSFTSTISVTPSVTPSQTGSLSTLSETPSGSPSSSPSKTVSRENQSERA